MVGRGGAVPERLGGSGGGREVRAPGRYFVIDVESNWLRGSVSHTRVRSPPRGQAQKLIEHADDRRSCSRCAVRRCAMGRISAVGMDNG